MAFSSYKQSLHILPQLGKNNLIALPFLSVKPKSAF